MPRGCLRCSERRAVILRGFQLKRAIQLIPLVIHIIDDCGGIVDDYRLIYS